MDYVKSPEIEIDREIEKLCPRMLLYVKPHGILAVWFRYQR